MIKFFESLGKAGVAFLYFFGADGDGDGFFGANEDDEFFAAGDACIE